MGLRSVNKYRGRAKLKIPGVMNATERGYAKHLEQKMLSGEILWFEYEPMKFRLAPKTTYTADFLVLTKDEFLEVHECKANSKGKPYIQESANVKIKVAAEKYPIFTFKLVWNVAGQWLVREY